MRLGGVSKNKGLRELLVLASVPSMDMARAAAKSSSMAAKGTEGEQVRPFLVCGIVLICHILKPKGRHRGIIRLASGKLPRTVKATHGPVHC